MMPRALGVDFGDRRVGVAVSDSMGIAATPVEVIEGKSPEQVAERIAWLAKDRSAAVLVVGLPINMDGSDHKSAAQIRTRAQLCAKKSGLPVEYVDERLTSVEAGRRLWEAGLTHKNRKDRVDRVAAALILQNWMQQRAAAARRAQIAAEDASAGRTGPDDVVVAADRAPADSPGSSETTGGADGPARVRRSES